MARNSDAAKQALANFRKDMAQGFKDVPTIVGTSAVNFALANFKNQGYGGKAWQARKTAKGRRNTELILQQSGELKNSFRILRTTAVSVVVGSALPYAQIHNEGGQINRPPRPENIVRNRYTKGTKKGKFKKGTTKGKGFNFRAYTITMPKRTFFMDDEFFKPIKNKAALGLFEPILKKYGYRK